MTSTRELEQHLQTVAGAVVFGATDVIRAITVALVMRGHILLEGVPGIGKTRLSKRVAAALGGTFQRIQGTADLMPSDITGVHVFERDSSRFAFRPGPLFADIVLVDEINRAGPKTQSALLEAMQERQVTIDRDTMPLPADFLVIATQNPAEYHGTFPLPESQLDRFLMRLRIGYPSPEEEKKVLDRPPSLHPAEELQPLLTTHDVLLLQEQVDHVLMEDSITDYLLAIVQRTRQSDLLSLGVSTRGALALSRAAKALSLVRGRTYCLPDDIKELAPIVLSHRIMVARTQGLRQRSFEQAERIIQDLVDTIPVPV